MVLGGTGIEPEQINPNTALDNMWLSRANHKRMLRYRQHPNLKKNATPLATMSG